MKKLCKCGCGQEVKGGNDYIHGHNQRGKVSYTSGDRWAVNYDACVECGTVDLPHAGRGLCRKCYKKYLYNNKKNNIGRWAQRYSKCVGCGKVDRPHKAKGLCDRCYGNEINRINGIKKRNFGAWSWYYDRCKQCGTTAVDHASNGLCKGCYDQSKRDLSNCVECPVCGAMVTKLNQHLTLKSKKCKEHYNYQHDLYKKYFESDLNLDDIAGEIGGGTERHSVSDQFTRFFGKEKTKERNENVRRCNISEKAVINHNSNNRFGTVVEYESPNQGTIKLRSKLEAEYAAFLDATNTDWLYESKSFPYLDKEGVRRTYTPDFYLPVEDKFIEVKGYEDGDSAEYKVNCILDAGINVEMIRQEELKELQK
jgi:hypothetical protein